MENINQQSDVLQVSTDDITDMLAELEINEELEGLSALETDVLLEADAEPETVVEEPTEELDQETERALDAEMTKNDLYEEQAETSISDIAAEAPPVPVKAVKAAKTPKEPAKPKVERDLASLNAETFVISTDIPEDLEANKIAVISKRPIQKKIAEKFDNLFASLAVGRAPSTFVMTSFGFLKAQGEITLAQLIACLEAAEYSKGTASSQAGQMMVLFDVTGIAVRDRQTLKLNPKSTIALALSEHLAPAA